MRTMTHNASDNILHVDPKILSTFSISMYIFADIERSEAFRTVHTGFSVKNLLGLLNPITAD